jgi:methionyl-tRNA formyltransferase
LALRLVFMGTPDFAVPTLLEIIGSGHEVVAVYTRAPKPAGRGMTLQPSPIGREAERFALPVFTPKTFKPAPEALPPGGENAQADAAMRAHRADAAIVVAYGLVLPKAVLAAFPLGAFNLHASLLPRWRGAAPIHRAVMAGDTETGVMVMKMDEGLDTGPIALAERVPIGPDATTGELHDDLKQRGASLMVRALAALEKGALQLTPQSSSGVTHANKIGKDETRIDWTRPWKKVHDHCRGLSPFPGAWSELPGAGRVKVLRTTKGVGEGPPGSVLDDRLTIACGTGSVRLLELQRAGRQPMSAEEFLRGMPVARASVLS